MPGEPTNSSQTTERERIAALTLAASYTTGATRETLLKEAASNQKDQIPSKTREIENLRRWCQNPCNSSLREISPTNILKNIYHLNNLENPTAELLYTLLALWRNCPMECRDNVISFLEKAAKQAMKFKDVEFIEFFRRVLDFPRRGLLNIRNPDFLELVNHTVAEAAGAKIYLAPETFLALRSRNS